LRTFVVACYRHCGACRGFRGAVVLQRRERAIQIIVLTRWRSLAAVRAFAGRDVNRVVVESEAHAVLRGFDTRVRHFEVVVDDMWPWSRRSARPLTRR
jgi:heme-degrading monooxygenase HmoA